MAGLLGNGWEDPQSAVIMALSGGLLRGDLSGGLLGAQKAYGDQKADAFKQRLQEAQYQETMAQAEERKQKMLMAQQAAARQDRLLNGDGSAPAQGAYQMGPDGMGPALPLGSAPQSGGLIGYARSIGMSEPVLQADLAFNGGKKISEMLNSRSAPKWENINGNLVNTNAQGFQGGLQGGMAAGKDGQVTAWQPDGRGGVVVGAPSGAMDTYRAFKQTDADIASGSELVKVTGPDGSERYVPKSQVLQAASPAPAQRTTPPMARPVAQAGPVAQPQGAYVGDQQVIVAAINDIKDPTERSNARRAYEQQYGALPAGPMQASKSTAQIAAAKGAEVTAEQTAKDVAETRKGIMNAGFTAPSNIAKYQQIGKLLEGVDGGTLTPTGTQIASAANSLGLKIDKNLPNKEAAASFANEAALQLRNPSGGAGMPGAMSDSDRNFLSSMTPNMTQSAQGRKQVIDSYVAVQKRNQQVATFARNWEKKHGALNNDFFEQMQAWSNANPLFGGR